MSKMIMSISEYGKEVRSYSDTEYSRFIDNCKALITNHLENRSKQKEWPEEAKNINIHIYTE